MKTKPMITAVAIVATMGACTTEDYYRSANRSPELSSTVNLDAVDTIKTSTISAQRTYIFPITALDENGNMNTLMVDATGGNATILVDGNLAIEPIELSKERYNFSREVKFTPTSDGKHTISVRVKDDFGNITSLEKTVYSFTNMRPKVECTIIDRVRAYPDNTLYTIDFSKCFDRDERWGGKIDSLFVHISWLTYVAENPDAFGNITAYDDITEKYPYSWENDISSDYDGDYLHPDKYKRAFYIFDDGAMWETDIFVWVKDNEGMVSDTVHFSLGHVE
ncbi:hypothetical protein FACS189452_10210 [Bacteroidia bacterium]|nr:hypothetical protein FACS189452_10210 [Bacteroidia bacterium]GHT81318.1 hypothetical protein FACS189467_5170 [Bacteroidia bacterium]